MSDYETLNWIETTIEVRYMDGSTRLIKLKSGDNLADAAGEGWISLSIVDSPYGAYSHNNIIPKGRINHSEAGSREGAEAPG